MLKTLSWILLPEENVIEIKLLKEIVVPFNLAYLNKITEVFLIKENFVLL
jgi:hypothetical protein